MRAERISGTGNWGNWIDKHETVLIIDQNRQKCGNGK
jgi:hypothetical protein